MAMRKRWRLGALVALLALGQLGCSSYGAYRQARSGLVPVWDALAGR